MAKEIIEFGNKGLAPLFGGDINRAQSDPNLRLEDGLGLAEGIFNPYRRAGYLSPANQSHKVITRTGSQTNYTSIPRSLLSDNSQSLVSANKTYLLSGQYLWQASGDNFTQLSSDTTTLGGEGNIFPTDMELYYLNNATVYPFILTNEINSDETSFTLLDSSESQKWTITNALQTGLNFLATGSVEVLVVAGGGGGGRDIAGGGGAGEYEYVASHALDSSGIVSPTGTVPFTVTVGGGGAGSTDVANKGGSGSNSTFDTLTAIGGGGGGSANNLNGASGGSGGGGAKSSGTGGSSTATGGGLGNAGGTANTQSGAGGGGSAGVGAAPNTTTGGAGGAGTSSSITGSSVTYAGGGKGGDNTGGTGASASANTGNGGGGGSGTGASGGAGGSGIVVIRYATDGSDGILAASTTGGTKTTDGTDTVHTFTSGGTLQVAFVENAFTIVSKRYNVSLPDSSSYFVIADKWTTSGDKRAWSFKIKNNDGTMQFELEISSAGTAATISLVQDVSISIGEWYTVGVTFSKENNEVKFYKNGSQVGSTQVPNLGAGNHIFPSTAGVGIGAQADTDTYFFDGAISDTRIWGRVLSGAEISSWNSNPGAFADGANLAAKWLFAADGTDETANNNDLTNNNTATFPGSLDYDQFIYYNASATTYNRVHLVDMSLDDYGKLVKADNGLLYLLTGNRVHKFDGTINGGTLGSMTLDVLKFPNTFSTRGGIDYRGNLYIGIVGFTKVQNSRDSRRAKEITSTIAPSFAGVYVWDRLSTTIRMRDFLQMPNIQDLVGFHISPEGSLRVFGIANDRTTELIELSTSGFLSIQRLGVDAYPAQPDGVGVSGKITYWMAQDGYLYSFGKVRSGGREVLAKLFDLNTVAVALGASGNVVTQAGSILTTGLLNTGQTDTSYKTDHEAILIGFQYGATAQTFTVTIASPGVITDTTHGLLNGDEVVLSTTGALPTGLAEDTIYYVVSKTDDTFRLATSPGGTAINTSGTQSGTHSYVHRVNAVVRYLPHSTIIVQSVTPVANVGNTYSEVALFPTLSNIHYVDIYCAPGGNTGSGTVATLKFYANQSTTAFKSFTVTRDMISRGYISISLNKQYVNALQMEVEWENTQQLGANDFAPSFANIDYSPSGAMDDSE